MTLNINGNFTVGRDCSINASGQIFNLNVTGNADFERGCVINANIDAGGDIDVGRDVIFAGNISASGNIDIDRNNNITGDVTAGGTLDIGNGSIVNGICSPTHPQCTGGGSGGLTCTITQIATDGEEFRGISGSSDSNIIAAGKKGSLYHYDGSAWSKNVFTSNEDLNDVEVVSSSLAYAVGKKGEVLEYNGSAWSTLPAPTGEELTGVWAASNTEVWVAGKKDALYLWNGSSWQDMSGGGQANVDNNQDLMDAWGDASSFYTVEKDGDLYRYSRTAGPWSKFGACNSSFDIEAEDVWGDGMGNIYIAGKDKGAKEAVVLLYNEGTNSCSRPFSSSTEDKVEGIYGNGSTVYAVGKKGLVLNNRTGSWSENVVGANDYKDVWVSNSGTAYYAGKNGFVTTCTEPTSLTDHLSIAHDGTAINCQPENITLAAHTATGPHDVDVAYTGSVNLSVDTVHGDWSYVSGGSAANLSNFGNGSATYVFDGSESGSVVLALANTFVETIDIDASDGTYSETSGSADASDDAPLTYDPSGFSFLANSLASAIGTQISGKSSDVGYGLQLLELEAINTNTVTGACEAALSGVVSVEIAFECENANTCQRSLYLGSAGPSTQVNGTNTDVVNPLNYTNVSLDFGSAADTTATFVMNYPDAGQIQLHARYTLLPSGEDLMGASNSFVVRPFGFDVDVPLNPFPPNPVPPYETASIFNSAGTGFAVDVAGALWNSADDNLGGSDGIPDNHDDIDPSNNDDLSSNTVTLGGTPYVGTPNFGQESEGIELTSLLFEPAGGNDPGLQGNTSMMSFSGGSQSLAGVVFDEVGIIEIAAGIGDLDYLGIGVAESGRMASKSGYLGRFTPATLSITTLTHGRFDNANSGGAVPFTYIGQDFGYEAGMEPSFTVSALNAGGGVTQNYTGVWAKLIADSANFTGPTGDSAQDGSDAITPMALTYTQNTDFNFVDSGVGTIEFEFQPDDDFNYDKDANSQVAPFAQDIDLVIADVTDGDGITTLAGATLEPLPPATPVGTQVRFGRLRMENAFGSELSDLIMNYYIEFYDEISGTPFWTLHDDVDTTIGFGEILEVPGNTAATAINPTFPLGKFEITLSAAMVDVTETITIPLDTSGEPWLQYDWDQLGLFDDNPSALATFGIFDGNPVQIYIQQTYE